jgi:plasmid stabilization system protein ParE
MAEIKWLPEAVTDLRRLHSFLQEYDQEAADNASGRILEGVKLLKTTPRLGRLMPEDDTQRRELYMPFGAGAYVIRYRFGGDNSVIIIRVWHSKETRV